MFTYNKSMSKKKIKKVKEEKPKKPQGVLKRVALSYRSIPNKKPYVEFLTALLSVPVLLTVILINLNALRGDKAKTPTPTPAVEKIYVTTAPGTSTNATNPTNDDCKKQVGPISITSPDEGETITDNPVYINIKYDQENYCSVVWSYRTNGGKWSDYDDNSIALYDLPNGNVKFELRVKSLVSSDNKSLTRNFTYKGNSGTNNASSSGN